MLRLRDVLVEEDVRACSCLSTYDLKASLLLHSAQTRRARSAVGVGPSVWQRGVPDFSSSWDEVPHAASASADMRPVDAALALGTKEVLGFSKYRFARGGSCIQTTGIRRACMPRSLTLVFKLRARSLPGCGPRYIPHVTT